MLLSRWFGGGVLYILDGAGQVAKSQGVPCGRSIDSKETVNLIGSDKVDGTAVYGADGNKIGSIQRVMIDKLSGKVAYAVLSFGGFLGMGEDYLSSSGES